MKINSKANPTINPKLNLVTILATILVTILTTASFLGSVPGTVDLVTPTEPLLKPGYQPLNPGPVNGGFGAYSYSPLTLATPGATWSYAGRYNIAY